MKKENIVFIVVGALIAIMASTITAYATNYLYNADEVSYNSTTDVQTAIDNLYSEAEEFAALRDMIYPVGSIYMSTTDSTVTAVANKFGGTWQKIEGRYLLASSSSYGVTTTGGQTSVSYTPGGAVVGHTLTAAESGIRSHTHNAYNNTNFLYFSGSGMGANTIKVGGTSSTSTSSAYLRAGASNSFSTATKTADASANASQSHTHTWSGTAATIATMPPYYSVYIYRRIA